MSNYPKRLYFKGEVIPGDLHAANSLIVDGPEAEDDARAKGYRIAWEAAEFGGNGGSPTESVTPTESAASVHLSPIQGVVADTSATNDGLDPADDDNTPEPTREELLSEAQALGLDPHHKTGVVKLKAMIAEAKAGV